MTKYYILLFIRNFHRNKIFSTVNLFGQSAGLCTALLIYTYVSFETSYDQFHGNASNIYRINQTFIWGDNVDEQFGSTGPGVGMAAQAEIPEVKAMCRLHSPGEYLVSYEQDTRKSFEEKKVLAVDSNFLDVFSFELLQGDEKTALEAPNQIVLTQETAKRYFGDVDPMNKLLTFEFGSSRDQELEAKAYKVAGVIEDVPNNSSIQFDMLMSMNSIPRVKHQSNSWIWTTFVTYVLLDEGADPDVVRKKLEPLPKKYAGTSLNWMTGGTFEDYIAEGKKWELFLQPISDVHHNTGVFNRLSVPVDPLILKSLGAAAFFIMLLSCINFSNLSIAQYVKRAKYTGIRKVLGSTSSQLSFNFMFEAFLYCAMSMAIAFVAIYYLLPWFANLVGQELSLDLILKPTAILISIGLLVGITLLAGFYPAAFLSRFNAMDSMKGKVNKGRDSAALRQGLIVVQFAVSLILIASAVILYQQLRFSHQKDLGFNRENVLTVNNLEWIENSKGFVNAVKQLPSVQNASWCSSAPPKLWGGDKFNPVNGESKSVAINYTTADEEYISGLELRLRYGRGFEKGRADDKNSVVLNEEAIRQIGWDLDESVIGKKLKYNSFGEIVEFKVVGVLQDFNFWTLDAPIEPFGLFHHESVMYGGDKRFALLRMSFDAEHNEETLQQTLVQIEETWVQFSNNRPFEYTFVDKAFEESFQSDERFASILTVFASMALLIATLGLLGMIIYAVEQRMKEISMRKVLGASYVNIAYNLSKEHAKMIIVAIIISTPITIYLMNSWLENYEYRIDISPFVFVGTSLLLIVVAASIAGYHAVRAASINPAEILRDE